MQHAGRGRVEVLALHFATSEGRRLFIRPFRRGSARLYQIGEATRLPQAPAIERDQPLPVTLGGRLVVAPTLREGETVMDAGT